MNTIILCIDPTSDLGIGVHRYCRDDNEARHVAAVLQSIQGETVECDGSFVYCYVPDDSCGTFGETFYAIAKEIETSGYGWEEV